MGIGKHTVYIYTWVRHKRAFFLQQGKNPPLFITKCDILDLSRQQGPCENVLSFHRVNKMSLCERIFIINEPVQFALPFDFDYYVVEYSHGDSFQLVWGALMSISCACAWIRAVASNICLVRSGNSRANSVTILRSRSRPARDPHGQTQTQQA